jgi:large conductance mechanosensitive channel
MKKAGAASIASWPAGSLLVALINFVVIAFVVFLIVRALESMKRRDARATDAAPDPQEQLALAASRLADALESRRI